MDAAPTLRFATAARSLAAACRQHGVAPPGFRSPPRLVGVDRSLRRRADGAAVVSVRLGGRPFAAVLADMVDGVVAANRLEGPAADRCRAALWEAVASEVSEPPVERTASRVA